MVKRKTRKFFGERKFELKKVGQKIEPYFIEKKGGIELD